MYDCDFTRFFSYWSFFLSKITSRSSFSSIETNLAFEFTEIKVIRIENAQTHLNKRVQIEIKEVKVPSSKT